MKSLVLSVLTLLSFALNAQMTSSFTDSRDGQVYKAVTYQIKDKSTVTWMAQNLNYNIEGSYCRNDSLKNCEKYGRLYTWPSAKECCPEGWKLPSNEDWSLLVNKFGGMESAGNDLKSKSTLWINNQGSNKSLFNAMPYGTGTSANGYHQFGRNAIFWSSDEVNKEYAWDWILVGGWKKIMRSDGHKLTTGNSVRCIKN